jgi:surfeit locus 1 family protein
MEKSPARVGLIIPGLAVLIALSILLSLGTWQVQRKAWKEGLIEQMTARLAAPPADLPAPTTWGRLDPADMEFRHVAFPAEFLGGEEALVFTSGSTFRGDVSGAGYWVFAPARLAGGSLVVVNRGFVPEDRKNPGTRAAGQVTGVVEVKGVLRFPEQPGFFTPKDDPARGIWFTRDQVAMAAARKWGPVAPFYVEQEAPPAPGGFPQAGKVQPTLPNNHLGYAITWYGLALVLVGVFAFWLRARRKERVDAEGTGR